VTKSTHLKSAAYAFQDHVNRQWIFERINRIYRIGDREVGITGFEISTFDNSEIESLPLTPWAGLGSLSPLRFDLVEKSVSARDAYNFDALWFRGLRPLLQDISDVAKNMV
jgi:hypothetical protein